MFSVVSFILVIVLWPEGGILCVSLERARTAINENYIRKNCMPSNKTAHYPSIESIWNPIPKTFNDTVGIYMPDKP